MLKRFPRVDEKGRRYTTIAHFRGVNMGPRPNLCYEWRGFRNPRPSGWRVSKERLEQEYQDGAVVIKPNGSLERRRFYQPSVGIKVGNVWTDVPSAPPTELIGYPTQKPLALLERIIKASSSEGYIFLDPFCGCGTAVDAAAKLGRKYLGIDISTIAVRVMEQRLRSRGENVAPSVYGLDWSDYDWEQFEKRALQNGADAEDGTPGWAWGGQSRGIAQCCA